MSTPDRRGGYIFPLFPPPNGPNDAPIIIYGYIPSFALCILAITLFTLASILHARSLLKYKTYYFLPLTLACILETIGYAFRTLSSRRDPYNVIDFVVQYFMIVTAPVFISASIYVCLSRLIMWAEGGEVGWRREGRWWFRPRVVLWSFVAADVVSTVVQIAGAASIGKAESNRKSPKVPNNILLGGLAFQTFAFTIFLILLAAFRYVLSTGAKRPAAVRAKDPFFAALGGASLLIYLRTIFRLAETSQGVFGYLSSHEGFFGGLEFAPVVVAVWVMAAWHPGRWIPGRRVKGREGAEGEGAVGEVVEEAKV